MDKIKKIKEWIYTRKLCTMDEHMKFYCKEAESDYNLLRSVEKVLDSIQKEPETSVWHDNKDTPVASKTKIVLYTNGKWDLFKAYKSDNNFDNYWASVNQSLEEKGVLVKHWAYVDDLLTLSNLETTKKERKEEPKKCMYSKDDYTDEDRKVLCDGCEKECKYIKSDDFTKALAECIMQAQGSVVDPMVQAEIWKDELIKLAKSEEPVSDDLESEIQRYNNSLNLDAEENYEWDDIASNVILAARHFAEWQKAKDESTTEDLGEYINELSKQFPEVSFAKLSRIAVRVAKWQKEQLEKNRLAHCDAQTEEEAEIEQSFVMGIIENEHRKPTFDDAIKYGMRLQKEQMMAKAIDAKIGSFTNGTIYDADFNIDSNLKDDDKVKVIVIKED